MAWAIWLAVPVGVTVLVAMVTWLRGRPARPPSTAQAMAEHERFLEALATRRPGGAEVTSPGRERGTTEGHSSPG